jgi:ketosteroid isomerase-like protein
MDPRPSPRVSGYDPPVMTDLAALEHQLNQLILEGRSLEAFERFYSDDIVMQENTDPPIVGKDRNREREQAFFGALADIRVTLLGDAVGAGVAYSEWVFELTFKDGRRVCMTEVSARRWQAGQVVHERFYYNPAG